MLKYKYAKVCYAKRVSRSICITVYHTNKEVLMYTLTGIFEDPKNQRDSG